MKIENLYKFFLILLFFQIGNIFSQDFRYSQFENNPFFLNPAMVGNFDAKYRIIANHRNQWRAITVPYKTYSFSLDGKFQIFKLQDTKIGGGLQINSDKAGDSNFSNDIFNFSISIHQKINEKYSFSVALMTAYQQFSIDMKNLKFNNQYDNNNNFYNPELEHNEKLYNDNDFLLDFSVGTLIKYSIDEKRNLSFGLSIFHINNSQFSFFNNDNVRLNRKYIAFFGGNLFWKNFEIHPIMQYMRQDKFNELDLGGKLKFDINNNFIFAVYAGVWHRWKDAEVFLIEFEFQNLNLGISYDINSSKLIEVSNGKGAFEISIIYMFGKMKIIKDYYKEVCPVFM